MKIARFEFEFERLSMCLDADLDPVERSHFTVPDRAIERSCISVEISDRLGCCGSCGQKYRNSFILPPRLSMSEASKPRWGTSTTSLVVCHRGEGDIGQLLVVLVFFFFFFPLFFLLVPSGRVSAWTHGACQAWEIRECNGAVQTRVIGGQSGEGRKCMAAG